MKKSIIVILTVALLIAAVAALGIGALAEGLPFESLFNYKNAFGGYTSDEGQILTIDYASSEPIAVTSGETLWFGPCDPTQYFQLVGQNDAGEAVTDKIRGKELTVADEFANGLVIYQYTVPEGVTKLVFSAPADVAQVYTVSRTALTELGWRAYWDQQGVSTEEYVGQNSYYEVSAGDKLYFGAITEEGALGSKLYNSSAELIGTMAAEDLRLVESFGGEFGIYCYTVPADAGISYIYVTYDADYQQYYTSIQLTAEETVTDEQIISDFITEYAIPLPLESTVSKLSGKTALFLGDSITYGARDRAKIYEYGGWAGRIGYFCDMDVTNNGVSGACITTARLESHSDGHYIYNNLIKTQGTTYDYVIMHGMFNDASILGVEVGEPQGKNSFDPAKADVTTFADALELLFYQARVQNPDAILGYIVNFHTDRAVDQTAFAEMAIRICEDWGVEYLDLYNRAGFSVEFDDGLHPSSAGYDSMYTIVANWMAGLDGKSDSEKTEYTGSAKVMSYNVFWDLTQKADKKYADIADRAVKVTELIKSEAPDILMLQEAHTDWVETLEKNGLTGYEAYGCCHKYGHQLGTCDDEMTPILWKSDKYTCVSKGSFLTADYGAASEAYPRCVSWVILQDKETGGKLLVMNYHADPNDETVRNLAAQLVMEKLDELRTANGGIPAILGGDLNMSATSTAYYTMVGNGVSDIRKVAAETTTVGSFNDWDRTQESKYALGDYLFMSAGIQADSFAVLYEKDVDEDTGKHISDHSPLVTMIQY